MKKIIFLIATTVLFSSCVVKPFQTQSLKDLGLSEQYKELTDTTNNIAQTPWKEIFKDKNLQDLIDTVLASNFDYKIALLRVDQSYALLRSSRAAIAPSFAAGAGYGTTANLTTGSIPDPDLNLALSMSWEVDIWGKLYAQKESYKASFWQTQEAAIAVRQSLIAATATAYFQLVALDAKLDVVEQNLITRRAYVQTTKDLKKSGKVNEVAVQQSIAQLKITEGALATILLATAEVENAVALLVGHDDYQVDRKYDIRNIENSVVLSEGTPIQLLSYRSDVRAAEMNYRSKHYLYMASRAALYPSLSLSVDATVASVFSAHSLILDGLASLTAPIFQGRKLRAAKESARVEAEISELQFKQSLCTAVVEVNDAMVAVKSYDIILTNQFEQFEALSKAYNYSDELFMSGYATYLDVLVAQTSLYDVEMSVVDGFLNCILSRIELYRALGGGAEDTAVVLPSTVINNDPAVK